MHKNDKIDREGRRRYGLEEMAEMRSDRTSTVAGRPDKGGRATLGSGLLFNPLNTEVEVNRTCEPEVFLKSDTFHCGGSVASLAANAPLPVHKRAIFSFMYTAYVGRDDLLQQDLLKNT